MEFRLLDEWMKRYPKNACRTPQKTLKPGGKIIVSDKNKIKGNF